MMKNNRRQDVVNEVGHRIYKTCYNHVKSYLLNHQDVIYIIPGKRLTFTTPYLSAPNIIFAAYFNTGYLKARYEKHK